MGVDTISEWPNAASFGCLRATHESTRGRSARTDAEIRFLADAFDAAETPGSRLLGCDGDISHVEVEIGDRVIMLFDAKPGWPPTPAHPRLYVDDAAASVERAVVAGARVMTHPTLLAFGERVARIRDPQGRLWWLRERV